MRIVHIAAEFAPLAKAGGLGEVVAGLCKEMGNANQVELILPKYGFLDLKNYPIEYENIQSYENNNWHNNTILKIAYQNFKLTLIKPDKTISLFNRPNIYGYNDDPARFIYFSRAALDYLHQQKEKIDVLHLHDWHTSLCAMLYKDLFQNIGVKIKKIVLTIHNLGYQGICNPRLLDNIGLKSNKYLNNTSLKKPFFFRPSANLLQGGIIYSDAIVAVSPSYSQEILTKKQGYGLDTILREQKHKLFGILNGIDTTIWNPQNDSKIKFHYHKDQSIEKIIETKKRNKEKLQESLGLRKDPSKPLISSIGRLVPQKGTELIKRGLLTTQKNKGQFILLGSSMIKKIQKEFTKLEKKYKDHEDISINFAYDEQLAHQIYSASDFIIIPSLFEPCGLTQLIALHYGTIPIVRKTGGLADTIFDLDDNSVNYSLKNGFTFDGFNKKELDDAIIRALNYWYTSPEKLHLLMKNGLNAIYDLKNTSKEYFNLYKKIIASE